MLSDHDFLPTVALSSQTQWWMCQESLFQMLPRCSIRYGPWLSQAKQMEITGPDPAVEEWLNDLVAPLHCQYDGSTGHKVSVLSYFKTDESGLKINCPLDISLDPSRPPLGLPLAWPGPNPEVSPLGWRWPLPQQLSSRRSRLRRPQLPGLGAARPVGWWAEGGPPPSLACPLRGDARVA